jgi:membrane-bound lytic murein transglycosylase D
MLNFKITYFFVLILTYSWVVAQNDTLSAPSNSKFYYGTESLFDKPKDTKKTIKAPVNDINAAPNIKEPSLNDLPIQDYIQQASNEYDKISANNSSNNLYNPIDLDIIKEYKIIHPLSSGTYPLNVDKIPLYTDNIYESRIQNIESLIPLYFDKIVGKFIKMYTIYKRDQVSKMLPKKDLYFPIFEGALVRHDLPQELKYLPIIESALIAHAKSDNGAVGLWQLHYGTARLYGLEATSFIDERRDPMLSSEVAVRHLKNLYIKYRDWHIVIAAFNCGEGEINRAIRQSGGRTSYAEIAPFLSPRAQSYVPLYIAAVYVMNYYVDHNIRKYEPVYSFYTVDTVNVKQHISFDEIAGYLSMTVDELRFLNPAILRDYIPTSKRGYPLQLPKSKTTLFNGYIANLNAYNSDIVIDNTKKKVIGLPDDNAWNYEMEEFGFKYEPKKIIDDRRLFVTYIVKEGNFLAEIADLYNCEVDDLKRWNSLKSNNLKVGQKIQILVPARYEKVYQNIEARTQDSFEKN